MEVLQLDSCVNIRCQWCDVFLHSSDQISATPPSSLLQVLYFLAMALTSESFIAERAQVGQDTPVL